MKYSLVFSFFSSTTSRACTNAMSGGSSLIAQPFSKRWDTNLCIKVLDELHHNAAEVHKHSFWKDLLLDNEWDWWACGAGIQVSRPLHACFHKLCVARHRRTCWLRACSADKVSNDNSPKRCSMQMYVYQISECKSCSSCRYVLICYWSLLTRVRVGAFFDNGSRSLTVT